MQAVDAAHPQPLRIDDGQIAINIRQVEPAR